MTSVSGMSSMFAICFACIEQDVVQIDPVNDNVRVLKPRP